MLDENLRTDVDQPGVLNKPAKRTLGLCGICT